MTDADIIKAAARAMCTREFPGKWDIISGPNQEWYRKLAVAAVVAVTPLIRAQVLEEAAKVVEDEDGEYSWAGEYRNMALLQQHSRELAAAIRALKEQP